MGRATLWISAYLLCAAAANPKVESGSTIPVSDPSEPKPDTAGRFPACKTSPLNNKLCGGHGTCRPKGCECDEGWGSADCSVGTYLVGCPNSCSGHGRCESSSCLCATHWSGEDCSVFAVTVNCSHQCSFHGECVEGACKCDPGFYGDHCQEGCQGYVQNMEGKSPPGFACSGHGQCMHDSQGFFCKCAHGFSGSVCSKEYIATAACPMDCNGNGECHHGKCICAQGFEGVDCGTDMNATPESVFKQKNKLTSIILLFVLASSFMAMMAVNFINGRKGWEMVPLLGAPPPPHYNTASNPSSQRNNGGP